jgi:hypothetical protein
LTIKSTSHTKHIFTASSLLPIPPY